MKKRLRKKFHLGEFREFGFNVSIQFVENFRDDDFDRFLDAFILEAIEGNELACGGGGRKTDCSFFVVSDKSRGSVTEEHRKLVHKWLENNSMVRHFNTGPLVDAWNDEGIQ